MASGVAGAHPSTEAAGLVNYKNKRFVVLIDENPHESILLTGKTSKWMCGYDFGVLLESSTLPFAFPSCLLEFSEEHSKESRVVNMSQHTYFDS